MARIRSRPGPAIHDGRSVDIRLLGPVEVIGPGGAALLPGSRQRAIVGLLALRGGAVVTRSALIDGLWGEDVPRTAVKTLYSHVTRIRQALAGCGLPDLLVTREPGYALLVAATDTDAGRLEDQLRLARVELAADTAEPVTDNLEPAGEAVALAVARLRAGLASCRGEPFADCPPLGWGAAEVARLQEVRLTAAEELWAAELRLGRHGVAAGELDRLVAAHPYRERLVRLLMLARYRSGRQAEALDAYQRLRVRLADELGVDPGPELQRLYARILRRDSGLDGRPGATASAGQAGGTASAGSAVPPPPRVSRPAQLPARVGYFTGRARELAGLDRLLVEPGAEARIVAISGPAGMGKTALAVQWAHGIRDRFPDGQLFLDLRGHEPATAVAPTDALGQMLRGLGVPADRVPAELAEQTALYRSLLHDKRVLILLDNCRGADQVLPLVPANEASLLVVTSRRQLAALATYHAVHLVSLDVLAHADALALLGRVSGAERVDREPAAAAELVALCGRMPLALRIAAAILAASGDRPIGELATSLAAENRLDALAIEGDARSVRTVFASAYHGVSRDAARLFRRLGSHPGVTFSDHLAAAAADIPLAAARRCLAELATAHLISEAGAGRHRFHDLLRLYAQECGQLEDTTADRAVTVARILDWYLAVAQAANRTLDPSRDRMVPTLTHPPRELPFAEDHTETLTFLDGERSNLVPLVRYAVGQGHDVAAYQLTYLLTGYFDFRGHWADRIDLCRLGVTAAQRHGDRFVESLMRGSLGLAFNAVHRFAEALDELRQSLRLARDGGDVRGQGNAHNNMAVAYSGLRRFDAAIDSFQQALALYTADEQVVAIALTLNNIGYIHARTGRTALSLDYLSRALRVIRRTGNQRLEAVVLHTMGQARLECGDHRRALTDLTRALEIRRRVGDRRFEAETLNHLGLAHLALGEHQAALSHLRRAVLVSRDAGDQHHEAVALNNTGLALLGVDEFEAAAAQFERALALRAQVPDGYEEAHVHRNLGRLYERRGDEVAAGRHRAAAIELYQRTEAWTEVRDCQRTPLAPVRLARQRGGPTGPG